MQTNLFQNKLNPITLHSGQKSNFKIECDALTDEDWKTLARLIAQRFLCRFRGVFGIPNGGLKLASELIPYARKDNDLPCLIVDDVLTTGASMEKARADLLKAGEKNIIGVVVFSRDRHPALWIEPIFQMW